MVKRSKAVRHSKAKHVILMILIALVFVFFVAYAIESVYPSPEYSDFCSVDRTFVDNQADCEIDGGKWTDDYRGKPVPVENGETGWCDIDYTCRAEYEEVKDVYERNVFLANLVFGIIAVVLSLFLAVEAVSTGFMAGGTIMIVYGTLRYWGNLSPVLRTLFLGVALWVLIYLGYKKLK